MRQNRGSARDPANAYKAWHWGIPSTKTVKWKDADYPDELIEIGKLAELHIRRTPSAPKQIINVSREFIGRSHVAFDHNHKAQRIYLYTPSEVRRAALRLWNPRAPRYALNVLARMAGGRHAADDYPAIEVQPLGLLTHITYFTWKKGDDDDQGGSFYIHEFSEESHANWPILAVDQQGRFWIAGGDYLCPNPGITN